MPRTRPAVALALLAVDGGEAAALDRAREVTARLAGTLMPRLQAELAGGDTAHALSVCAEDEAVGYAAGDLRGAVSVRVELDAP